MTTPHTPLALEVCDYCGEPFDDAHPVPWRFEIGSFVGNVHKGACVVALFDDDNRARFGRRPRWQQRLIWRTAGSPPRQR
jgi:hypothetical protein